MAEKIVRLPVHRHIAELRRRRIAAGMSQHALAKAAGIAPSTLYETEMGFTTPLMSTFFALAQALGWDMS